MQRLRHLWVFAPLFLFSFSALAETIEFPEEELATESVLPVFDKTVVVRERLIKTEGKIEIGAGGGLNLAEPLYGQAVFNFSAGYHLSELHGFGFSAFFLDTGLSKAGTDLKNGKGLAGADFDASLAPTVESMYFVNYMLTAYYGKLSMTKQSTLRLSLYGFIGAGLVQWTDETSMALDLGVGQKLYFTPNIALQFDLMMALYQGADPTSPKEGQLNGSRSRKSNEFDSTVYIRPFLTTSLVVLF